MNVAGGPTAVQECLFGVADGNDAGKSGEALLQIGVKLLRLLVGVTGEMGINAEEQDILRVEAGMDAVKIAQGTDEKSRTDEDDHRERDLRDDERIAETKPAAGVRRGTTRPRRSR